MSYVKRIVSHFSQALMAGSWPLPPALQGEAVMTSASSPTLDALTRKLESIASLSDEEKQAVENLPLTIRALRPGQDIAREGDCPPHCAVILQGWTFRYKQLREGRRQILSFHVAGDMLDLQSLHLPVMDHSLGVLTDAKVAFIPHESIRNLTARFPGISAALWRDTLIDSAIYRERITGLGCRSAAQRIAHLFCELYLKLEAAGLAHDLHCSLPLTQADLGEALGLSTVHVNRSLQNLRAAGLITVSNKLLTIKDWQQLKRISKFDPLYLHLQQNTAA